MTRTMSKKLRLAFVGFRHGHINGLYKSARQHPRVEVVAAVLLYRAFTIVPTLLLGLGTIAAWRWLGPGREREGVDATAGNPPGG